MPDKHILNSKRKQLGKTRTGHDSAKLTQSMRSALFSSVVALCLTAGLHAATAPTWNPKAAAAYLDGRSDWWQSWPNAARDHGTFCVSCHTAAPYAISRLALRSALGEQGPSDTERKLVDNVTKRVRGWAEMEPFYKDGKSGPTKSIESRGTESILNALILATYKSPEVGVAFDNMWALQYKTGDNKGSWPWLDFKNRPWEADNSPYYGAALAAVAIGTAPDNYRSRPEIHEGVELLKDYLQHNFDAQSPINQLIGLWAGAKLPGVIRADQRKAALDRIMAAQQEDGGWSLTSLAGTWKRRDATELETRSDGYATGLVLFALQKSGMPRDRKEMKRGLAWLMENQSAPDGRWLAYSLNKNRDLSRDIGKFMSDAATGYAVLALTGGN